MSAYVTPKQCNDLREACPGKRAVPVGSLLKILIPLFLLLASGIGYTIRETHAAREAAAATETEVRIRAEDQQRMSESLHRIEQDVAEIKAAVATP